MAAAMQAIVNEMIDELAMQSDKGTEMHAAPFQRLPRSRDIHFVTSKNDDIKCTVVERFQKTLQGIIQRHIPSHPNNNAVMGSCIGTPCLHSAPRWRILLHGLHAAQQRQPGVVPRIHRHKLLSGAARVRSAAQQ